MAITETRRMQGGQRVLAIHRYFSPDTPPYASILRSIALAWINAGHDVDVVTSQPSYKPEVVLDRRPRTEVMDGIRVRRMSVRSDRGSRLVRVANTAYFSLRAFLAVLVGPRYDIVMCSTAPPIALAYVTSAAARIRGARFYYHCMDIHPEIGALSGEFRFKPLFRLLQRLDTVSCTRASRIVVLSSDMREALATRDERLRDKIRVLNNFDLPDHETTGNCATPLLRQPHRTRLVFAGNIGRFQGLEALVESVLTPRDDFASLELVFMGEGAAKRELMELVRRGPKESDGRVVFLPHGTAAEARALMRCADYGVVSLMPGVIRYAYPSKCATYLSEGTPLLGLVEGDSELANEVRSREIGVTADPREPSQILEVLAAVTADQDAQRRRSARAHDVWQSDFSQDVQLPRWVSLLEGDVRVEATG